jgi:hypothetical protein
MVFGLLFIIPLLVILGFFILTKGTITFKEVLVQIGVQAIVAGISVAILYYSDTHDTEIWNGRVTAKSRDVVSCSHSYRCRCYTTCYGSGQNRHCTEHCQTCYRHDFDVDWTVKTTVGSLEISREDSQGLIEPKRWSAVVIGEPASRENSYTNYIKAAPGTLFKYQGFVEKFETSFPKYPKVNDYYRVSRVFNISQAKIDVASWDNQLDLINAELGHKKQSNAILIITNQPSTDWYYGLEQYWIGGKKNDVVVVISVDSTNVIRWAKAMAWTDNNMLKVAMRDDIMDIGKLDQPAIMSAIRKNIEAHYVRKPMKDFEYLKSSITPTPLGFGISMIIGLTISVGLGIFMHKEDLFGENTFNRRF